MEKNAGYEIRESVLFDNGRGFALGEAEQMKAAKEQTEKPVDKVREMPPKAKSREREER